MNEIAFLCAPTYRSKAYAQAMCTCGFLPSQVIHLDGGEPHWNGAKTIKTRFSKFTFKPNEFVRDTFKKAGVSIIYSTTTNVNSDDIINEIDRIDAPIIVYSGYPGVLLGSAILKKGKTFLHIHGGVTPEYRGSTAFYFSLLREGTIGATALYINKQIDCGPVIACKSYYPDPKIEIDRIQDQLVRADLLIDVLRLIKDGKTPDGVPQASGGTTYHVIHPVLKNLALKKISL